jgi:hypothetical protein
VLAVGSTIALVSILGLGLGHGLAPAAPERPTIGVLPLEVEGELVASWREEADRRLGLALRRGDVDVVDLAEATASCADLDCRLRAARDAGAGYVLQTRLTVEPGARDYTLDFELFAAEGGKRIAAIDGSCELCGFEEAVGMVEARAAVVLSTLSRSVARGSALSLRTQPAGARIVIDGEDAGVTPLTLQLTAGPHRIALRKEGHLPQTLEVEVIEGVNKEMELQLLPAPVSEDPSARGLVIGGALGLGLGVASLAAGIALVVVHDDPYRRDCQADLDGDCRFLLGTRTGGIVAASVGGAAIAAGATLLGVGMKRKRRARAAISALPGLTVRF